MCYDIACVINKYVGKQTP